MSMTNILLLITLAQVCFGLPGLPINSGLMDEPTVSHSSSELFFPMDEDLEMDNALYQLCESIQERARNCSPTKCRFVLYRLDQLNRHQDFTEESKARMILDIWGDDFIEDEHQECINESLAIARQHDLILPPEPIRLPDCETALAALPHCRMEDCQALIDGYREYNERQDFRHRSDIATRIWSFHQVGPRNPTSCFIASMNEVRAAGLSLVITVESEMGGRAIAFL